MGRPIDKDYLIASLKSFDEKIISKKYSQGGSSGEPVNLENYYTKTETESYVQDKITDIKIPSLAGYATEKFVSDAIAEVTLSGGNVDLSGYIDKDTYNTDKENYSTTAETETMINNKIAEIEIPSIVGLVSENKLSETLADYAKSSEIPTVTNDLTNELKSNYDNAVTNSHVHGNKDVLNLIAQSDDGKLLFNGEEIKGANSEAGKTITNIEIDEYNNIFVTFSDGTTENIGKITVNVPADFLTSDGFGNLRFIDNKFQYFDKASNQWADTYVTLENSCVVNLTPQPMQKFIATCDLDTVNVELLIQEPNDTIIDGQSLCMVEKVIIRRKKDESPIDENDGDLVIEIKRKDFGTYKDSPYIDVVDNVVVGNVYYYKAFPVSNTGVVSNIAENEVSCLIKDYYLYGFRLDQLESDPASMIAYLEDCDNANYQPVFMDYESDAFNYGDWESAWFIKKLRPCMLNYDGTVAYELNPNDYTKKINGTISDIADENFEGNVMIGIPKIYWKIVDNRNDTANIYFCSKKLDNDFVCWSHLDSNGKEIDYCYMPAYTGYSTGGKLRSLSDKAPSYREFLNKEIGWAQANNQGSNVLWDVEVFCDRMLINLLLLLIGKSTDTQAVFGNGNCVSGSRIKTGTMNDKGLFWGSNSSDMIGVKVFGMENWWGNHQRKLVGWINNKGIQQIKLTYGKSDGSTVNGYNLDGSGYITLDCSYSGSSNGYIKKMAITKYGLIPTTTGGSSTTYYTDGLSFNLSKVCPAMFGGASTSDSNAGALCCSLASDSANNQNVGVAISCKPLAIT